MWCAVAAWNTDCELIKLLKALGYEAAADDCFNSVAIPTKLQDVGGV